MRRLILFLFLLFVLPASVFAHDATLTYTSISLVGDKINVAITTPEKNILEVYPKSGVAIEDLDLKFFLKNVKEGFVIENEGKWCNPQILGIKTIPDLASIAYQFEYICDTPINNLKFSYNLFFDVSKTHENIADLYIGEFGEQIIFSKDNKVYEVSVGDIKEGLGRYNLLWKIFNFLFLGIEHILIGYDHILFLLALILSAKSLGSLIKIVSSFTLAHSITLIIATLGIFVLPAKLTESLIALSISFVAVENLLNRGKIKNRIVKKIIDPSERWVVAFAFGLIHGFGFSSVLKEIGLPQNALIQSLISFNVGVEVGQIAILLIAFPILLFIRRRKWSDKFTKIASIVIGFIGLFWFIERIL